VSAGEDANPIDQFQPEAIPSTQSLQQSGFRKDGTLHGGREGGSANHATKQITSSGVEQGMQQGTRFPERMR
jgi:hypothetical protein